jgi:hypothetical protein
LKAYGLLLKFFYNDYGFFLTILIKYSESGQLMNHLQSLLARLSLVALLAGCSPTWHFGTERIDVNSDGLDDKVELDEGNGVSIKFKIPGYLGPANFFKVPGALAYKFEDLNGNGNLDLLVRVGPSGEPKTVVLYANGDSTYQDPVEYSPK